MSNGNFEQSGPGFDGAHEESEEGFDFAKLRQYTGFFLRAPRRRPKLAIGIAISALCVAVCLAAFLPRSYESSIRVLARRSMVPLHEGGPPPPDPTAGAGDEIMKHDNLVALIRQLDLLTRWEASRPLVLRWKDAIVDAIGGPQSEDDKIRSLVAVLEKRLVVSSEPTSITFSVEWPNPQTAFDLVSAAYKAFLDTRYDAEVSAYGRRAQLLELRAELSARDLDAAIADLAKVDQERRRAFGVAESAATTPATAVTPVASGVAGATAPVAIPPAPHPAPPAASEQGVPDDTAAALQEVRGQIRTIEDETRRRTADAESQLADATATLGPLHPNVLALKRKVETLHEPSPQLEALRAKEKSLVGKLAEFAPAAAARPGPEGGGAAAPPAAPGPGKELGMSETLRELLRDKDDAPTAYARAKLTSISQQYNEILNEMHAAKVELQVARDAFADTYTISRPAEVAKRPKKPNVAIILAAGVAFSLLLLFLAPGSRDLLGGRILEPWQIESVLKLPVLGPVPATEELPPATSDTGPPD